MGTYARTDDRMVLPTTRKRKGRRRTGARLRGLIAVIVIVTGYKVALLAAVGPAAYEERLSTLGEGVLEQAGAWVLQADPLTTWLAMNLRALVA